MGTAVEAVRGPDGAGRQAAEPGVPVAAWLLWLWARLVVALVEVAQLRGALAVALAELAESLSVKLY